MREHVFTVAITCASRALILRDRLRGLPRNMPEEALRRICVTRSRIASGTNSLDAILVESAGNPAKASVLICHGIGETVDHWLAAQTLLAQNDVASLVFNYSGYGRSTGRIAASQCECDALAAFQFLRQLVPSVPMSLLGFSLGSGVATAIVTRVPADRLILCAAFTSLRDAAHSIGVPRWLAQALPAIWNTEAALRSSTVPVLIVQGQQDRLFSAQMGRDLARACTAPCELMLVPGLSHNAPIYEPDSAYWAMIAARVISANP